MDGTVPQICGSCTRQETAGEISRRHRINQRYLGEKEPHTAHDQVQALLDQTTPDGHSSTPLKGVDLYLGNTCQLRCVQCNPSYSRSILKDYQRLGWDFNDKNRMPMSPEQRISKQDPLIHQLLDQVKKSINTLDYIKLMGGEPTLIQPLLDFLEWCVAHGHHRRITLYLYTNAVTVSEHFIELLSQFQKVHLGISVDAVGGLDEWIRYPTNWEKKCHNIERLASKFPLAWIETTVFSFNIHHLPKLISWCRDKNYSQHIYCLNYPESLSIQNLPTDDKIPLAQELAKFAETLPQDSINDKGLHTMENRYRAFITAAVEFMMKNPHDPAQWQKCLDIVNGYNTIRSQPLQQHNPFFAKFLK
jgi:MoaA/NifB/PqqE/SkfB family radical SAM enzyme